MKSSTLLGVIVGAAIGAYMVDTFQPAQDLLDNCKRGVRYKAHDLSRYAKNTSSDIKDDVLDKLEDVKEKVSNKKDEIVSKIKK